MSNPLTYFSESAITCMYTRMCIFGWRELRIIFWFAYFWAALYVHLFKVFWKAPKIPICQFFLPLSILQLMKFIPIYRPSDWKRHPFRVQPLLALLLYHKEYPYIGEDNPPQGYPQHLTHRLPKSVLPKNTTQLPQPNPESSAVTIRPNATSLARSFTVVIFAYGLMFYYE